MTPNARCCTARLVYFVAALAARGALAKEEGSVVKKQLIAQAELKHEHERLASQLLAQPSLRRNRHARFLPLLHNT